MRWTYIEFVFILPWSAYWGYWIRVDKNSLSNETKMTTHDGVGKPELSGQTDKGECIVKP